MGRRPKGAPNPVVPLGKKIEDVLFEWEYEGEKLEVRHVATAGRHGVHVRLVMPGKTFDRELSRVFLANGWDEKQLVTWGNAAFELTFPPMTEMEDPNAE